jgi:hypothetical protein
MLGMDPLYFYTDAAGEQPYATSIGQSPKLSHPQALEHELLVQNHFQSQLLSPTHGTHHQRRDSFFPCSPSSASTSGGPSPCQAIVQPYLSDIQMAQRGQMSNSMAMGRSKSQQSLYSPEQTQYDQHRASLGHGSEFGASNMSRTSTQQSSNPAAYQTWLTAPRPDIIRPPVELTGYASWDTEYALPMSAATVSHYGPRPNTTNRANSSHTQSSSGGDHMARIGSISETFHQARNRSGTFGDSTFSE